MAATALAFAALCGLILALPGQTITTKYLDGLFVALDGAHRLTAGEVPHRDFHTPLGPLAYFLPALGYWLTGNLGGAMPAGMALLVLALAPAMAHILGSRLKPVIALPFGAFLILILAVPINLGEGVTALSFAMFYNRIGWAALATLLVMYLRPEEEPRPRQVLLDAICAAALTLVMIYTKITYGLVALAFLTSMLFDPRQRRWAALALGMILATGVIVEGTWQSSAAYLSDLLLAAKASGGLRGTWGQITDHLLGNLSDLVMLALFAGLALWRTRSLRDALFYGFCAVSGFLIINQNFQVWGIITIHAAAAVATETLLRSPAEPLDRNERPWSVRAGASLLFLVLVLPPIVHFAISLGLHAAVAGMRAGEALALPNLGRVRLVNLWTWNEHETATRYLATLQEGARALSGLDPKPSRISVLDLANPFSAILRAQPARGDSSWLLWGRNMDAANFIPGDQLLADVQVLMEPRPLLEDPALPSAEPADATRQALQTLYRPYIAANFDLVRETEHWRVHRRRQPLATGCSSGCNVRVADRTATTKGGGP